MRAFASGVIPSIPLSRHHGAVCSLITAQDVGYMMSPAFCGNIRLFAAIAGLLNRYAYRVFVELRQPKQRRDNLVITGLSSPGCRGGVISSALKPLNQIVDKTGERMLRHACSGVCSSRARPRRTVSAIGTHRNGPSGFGFVSGFYCRKACLP